MFYNSKQFQVMQSGLNALSMQQRAILHNLANYETPNYKSKHVVFEDALKNATEKGKIRARVETDTVSNVRVDGNNVNSEVESMKLYENYVQSLYIYQKMGTDINNYRYALKQGPR